MGLNTACIIRNDFLHQLRDDPKLGEKIWSAVVSGSHAGYHGQGFDVLPSSHSSSIQVVAVGGNMIRHIGFCGDSNATDIDILHNLAASMGYRIVKKGAANVA